MEKIKLTEIYNEDISKLREILKDRRFDGLQNSSKEALEDMDVQLSEGFLHKHFMLSFYAEKDMREVGYSEVDMAWFRVREYFIKNVSTLQKDAVFLRDDVDACRRMAVIMMDSHTNNLPTKFVKCRQISPELFDTLLDKMLLEQRTLSMVRRVSMGERVASVARDYSLSPPRVRDLISRVVHKFWEPIRILPQVKQII